MAPKSPVNKLKAIALIIALYLVATSPTAGQALSNSPDLQQVEVDRIINTFTAKESQFRKALKEYAFKRDATLQSLGMGGQITGEYHRVSYFTFDDQGNRFEKISYFPMPTFGGSVTQEDLNDLGGMDARHASSIASPALSTPCSSSAPSAPTGARACIATGPRTRTRARRRRATDTSGTGTRASTRSPGAATTSLARASASVII